MISSKLKIKPLVVGPLLSNCYIVWDSQKKKGIIIDPGEDADLILKTVAELGIEIKYILATHGHFDHVGAVNQIKKKLNAKFLAHEGDFFFIEDGKNAARRWGFIIDQPPKPDQFIKDGDIIDVGDFNFEVLHTPGHSPGGVSFLYNSMVFSGDTLFQGSIGRTDFRQGSMDTLEESIKKRLYVLPDETVVYTGHGPLTTIGDEKKFNPFVRG